MHLITFPFLADFLEPVFLFVFPPIRATGNKVNRDIVGRSAFNNNLKIRGGYSFAPCFYYCAKFPRKSKLSIGPFRRRQASRYRVHVATADSPEQSFHGGFRRRVTGISELTCRPRLGSRNVVMTNDNCRGGQNK